MSNPPELTRGQVLDLQRDLDVISIPFGKTLTLPAGTQVSVMQAKGTSISVSFEGRLYLVESHHLDALGLPPTEKPYLASGASAAELEAFIWAQLRTCFDPEIPVNIVDLGLVYGCKLVHLLDGRTLAQIKMTLTAPGCGMGEVIAQDAKRKILGAEDLDAVNIEIVFDPPWSREMMSEDARLELGMF